MILVVDIGNTNITIGGYEKDSLCFTSRMATDRSRMEDQYAIELRDILDIYGYSRTDINGSIISSVVPALTSYIKGAIKKVTDTTALVVGPGIKTGLNIRIDNPATLGADLAAGCVGAIESFSCPCIVIDMGTATTFGVLDENKNMVGGCIMPGTGISLDALVSRTAQLPQISLEAPQKVIGKNTIDCMSSGSVFGTAAMIDGMCQRIEEELQQKCTIVATGGIAKIIVPHCKKDIALSENLLLDGLRVLFEKNQ